MPDDRVRFLPDQVIDALLAWCADAPTARPDAVAAVGLAYGFGLNEHQLARTTVEAIAPGLVLAYPKARRTAAIREAETASLPLAEPEWLLAAVESLVLQRRAAQGDYLLGTSGRLNLPLQPARIRRLVADAGAEATGVRVSCATLVSSRTRAIQELGTPFALFGIGFADAWASRLSRATPVLLVPRPAR